MKRIIIGLVFFLYNASLYAEGYPEWFLQALHQDNPKELAYYSHVNGNCPITEEEVKEIAKAVFVENAVRPVTSFGSADLYMDISIECIGHNSDHSTFTLSVKFGQYKVMPATLYNWNIGEFGIGPRTIITQSLKSKVEEAMIAYRSANPEL